MVGGHHWEAKMGIVVYFQRHARASTGSRGNAANASKVICEQPFSAASRTISDQRPGGMPRVRQVLTVLAGKPSPADTAPVPPRSSIAESAVSCMDASIVRSLRTSQEFAPCETTFPPEHAALPLMAESVKDIGQRLLEARLALGFSSQVDFCNEIKVEKNIYNPFERGKRRITIDVAVKIKKRFGIPLDWTYCGDPSALPLQFSQKLARLAA